VARLTQGTMTTQTEVTQRNHHRAVRFFWALLIGATVVSLIGKRIRYSDIARRRVVIAKLSPDLRYCDRGFAIGQRMIGEPVSGVTRPRRM
jgi:hypothetical protein